MRKLNKRQKALLDIYFLRGITSINEIPENALDAISKVNLFENFDSCAERYLMDKFFASKRKEVF